MARAEDRACAACGAAFRPPPTYRGRDVSSVATNPARIAIGSLRYWRLLARVASHRHAHRRELHMITAMGAGTVIRNLALRQGY